MSREGNIIEYKPANKREKRPNYRFLCEIYSIKQGRYTHNSSRGAKAKAITALVTPGAPARTELVTIIDGDTANSCRASTCHHRGNK